MPTLGDAYRKFAKLLKRQQLLDTELDKCCFKSAHYSARRGGDIHGPGGELIKCGVFRSLANVE